MPKTTKTKKVTKSSPSPPPPSPVEETVQEVVEETVQEPVEEVSNSQTNDEVNSSSNDNTMFQQFETVVNSVKVISEQLRNMVKVMKTLRSHVAKMERAEQKRMSKRKNKGERKSNSNSGFQKTHNIAGTPLAKFLNTDEASMANAHTAICAYIKSREGVPKFPGDNRIIVMDETLDNIFPGLMENYPAAIELAQKAVEDISDNKERRAYLNKNVFNTDKVLTFSGIMKRLPMYFKSNNA